MKIAFPFESFLRGSLQNRTTFWVSQKYAHTRVILEVCRSTRIQLFENTAQKIVQLYYDQSSTSDNNASFVRILHQPNYVIDTNFLHDIDTVISNCILT
jgi:hypothetical protein